MHLPIGVIAALLLVIPFSASAALTCADVLNALRRDLVDATCFVSADLTTNNEQTTPLNNSLPGLPPFAFTPRTDRDVISPSAPKRAPITKAVPGLQIQARIASDPLGQARFLLRLPNDWNGRLVVAGASGTRSEFNGDFAWSDLVVQQGYAYASQNKGVLNLRLSTAADPLACRLNPDLPVFVTFYANDPGQVFTRWAEFMIEAARIARDGVKASYGPPPRFTYAVGTSNGGYQVRRAVELGAETLRRRRRLGRHFRRRARPQHPHRPAARDSQLPRLSRGRIQRREYRGEEHPGRGLSAGHRQLDFAGADVLEQSLEFVLGGDAVPMAKAPRSDLPHLHQRHRHL